MARTVSAFKHECDMTNCQTTVTQQTPSSSVDTRHVGYATDNTRSLTAGQEG